VAFERWTESSAGSEHEGPRFFVDVREALRRTDGPFDLGIVSTSAGPRTEIVETMAREGSFRFLILEKVLAQSSEDVRRILRAVAQNGVTYVNTPYRAMPAYDALLGATQPPLTVRIEGGGWGPGSNAIHHLDLVSWATGSQPASIAISASSRDWYESKRLSYFDFYGTIEIRFDDGSSLAMTSNEESFGFISRIRDAVGREWIVNELNRTVVTPSHAVLPFNVEKQSDMTPRIVEQLFTEGTCGLPSLSDSAALHIFLLNAFEAQQRDVFVAANHRVPIT
jgi:hypothetical protein